MHGWLQAAWRRASPMQRQAWTGCFRSRAPLRAFPPPLDSQAAARPGPGPGSAWHPAVRGVRPGARSLGWGGGGAARCPRGQTEPSAGPGAQEAFPAGHVTPGEIMAKALAPGPCGASWGGGRRGCGRGVLAGAGCVHETGPQAGARRRRGDPACPVPVAPELGCSRCAERGRRAGRSSPCPAGAQQGGARPQAAAARFLARVHPRAEDPHLSLVLDRAGPGPAWRGAEPQPPAPAPSVAPAAPARLHFHSPWPQKPQSTARPFRSDSSPCVRHSPRAQPGQGSLLPPLRPSVRPWLGGCKGGRREVERAGTCREQVPGGDSLARPC